MKSVLKSTIEVFVDKDYQELLMDEMKQWALDMVGEDTNENLPEPDEQQYEEGQNRAKQEIRERIEGLTK